MGYRPLKFCRITQHFANPGSYASVKDLHGPAGHHTGIDFGKSLVPYWDINGKAVKSSTPGRVVISDYNSTMGNWVGVYYPKDDVTITYWHLSKRIVQVGDSIFRGQTIGFVGSTGNSTAPHLHVQANRGSGFNYSGHIAPGKWVRGRVWAGFQKTKKRRR